MWNIDKGNGKLYQIASVFYFSVYEVLNLFLYLIIQLCNIVDTNFARGELNNLFYWIWFFVLEYNDLTKVGARFTLRSCAKNWIDEGIDYCEFSIQLLHLFY